MAQLPEPLRGLPDTYFVENRSNGAELRRLQIQDQMLTTSMGGVLPEQPDKTRFNRILDVGCGTGHWLREVARTGSTASLLVGIDTDPHLIIHAREQSADLKLSHLQFRQMDALGRLDFPDYSFDLVNQRFGTSFLRTFEWLKLLREYQRVCQPGGVIRVTEFNVGETRYSPALEALSTLFVQALFRAGRFFTEEKNGLTSQLVSLFQQAGIKSVQSRAWTFEFQATTNEGQLFIENLSILYRTLLPFLRKWTKVPSNYEEIYQQATKEMQQPDFVATMSLLTVWGEAPPARKLKEMSAKAP